MSLDDPDHCHRPSHRTGVLFIQSQTYFGADSQMHALIMRGLDRSRFDVHAATNCVDPSCRCSPVQALSQIPDLDISRVRFPPTLESRSRGEVVRKAPAELGGAVSSTASLVRHARRHRIRIIHCTEKPRDVLTGYVVARAVGARLVIHLHVKAEAWISPVVRRLMHRADALVGVSEFVSDSIVDLGYQRPRTHTILNGMDFTGWQPDPEAGRAVRLELGIDPRAPVLAIVARLFQWKGHERLFRAAAAVRDEHPSVRLLVVGEDDPRAHPGGGSYTEELRALSRSLGIEDQIVFTGFRSDVARLMSACDVYAMPSFEEPFGMVYLEAMALEKPVLALRSGGVPEVVAHGKTALLADPDDTAALVANLRRLLSDPVLRAEMGAAGRARALAHFSYHRMARDTEELYGSLVGLPSPARATIASAA